MSGRRGRRQHLLHREMLRRVLPLSWNFSRKEVIQPQVLLRLPCYDFTPVMEHTLVSVLPCGLNYLLLASSTSMV